MTKLPQLLPPSDLLEQIGGIERGLRRGRAASVVGVVVAAVQITILLANSDWLAALLSLDFEKVWDSWPLLLSLFLLVIAVVVAVWTRFWMHESRQPFRYTFWVAPFAAAAGDEVLAELAPLESDLRERLCARISRLSLLDEAAAPTSSDDGVGRDSHIHISGYYARRLRPPEPWVVEVVLWIRTGGADKPARLALPVHFPLAAEAADGQRPKISEKEYEQILERTYFSVATELYRQVKDDVARKIALLPTRRFRASALLHEAQDHERSNTLDAYNEARELYAQAVQIYDRSVAPAPDGRVRRGAAAAATWSGRRVRRLRRRLAWVLPRVGASEVLTARAQIGYANTLLYSNTLAAISGRRSYPVYEARPIARRAVDSLGQMPHDVRGRDHSLFDAHVTLAYAEHMASAVAVAASELAAARGADPFRAQIDPHYLFVAALVEGKRLDRIRFLRVAVDADPNFEAARFELASAEEMLWRTRPTLEQPAAETVFAEYQAIIALNPGNIAPWSNRGYMKWLLGDIAGARRDFHDGRQYKEIKHDTWVAELDYGLARCAAEEGDLNAAYRHYVASVSAMLANSGGGGSFAEYHFELVSDNVLRRFDRYRANVERLRSSDAGSATTPRIADSVYAFVLNDYGDAYRYAYLRTRDFDALDRAYEAYTKAIELNPDYVVPYFNLYWLQRERQPMLGGGIDPAQCLQQVDERERQWQEAALELLVHHAEQARDFRAEASRVEVELQQQLNLLRTSSGYRDQGPGVDGAPADSAEPTQALAPDFAAVERLRRKLDRLTTSADDEAEQAARLPRLLLPHDWFWRQTPGGAPLEIDWDVVTSARCERELRWERSFDAFQVGALLKWCEALALEAPDQQAKIDELLKLIEQRLLPNDFSLVELMRRRAEERGDDDAVAECSRRLNALVESTLATDERQFALLSWLSLDDRHALDRLERLARDESLSPYLHWWIGDRLYEAADDDELRQAAAILALKKAARMERGAPLLQLADRLAQAGDDDALAVYLRAADCASDAETLSEVGSRLEGQSRLRESLRVYRRARQAAVKDADRRWVTVLDVSIARVLWALGSFAAARHRLDVVASAGEADAGWRSSLVEALVAAGHVGGRRGHILLRGWLEATQRTTLGVDAAAAVDAAAGTFALAGSRDSGTPGQRVSDGDTSSYPLVRPILLEADEAFFPSAGETPGVARMIDELIPERRRRILVATGVDIPGIRIHSSETLTDRAYAVSVNGWQVEQATVPPDVDDPYAFLVGAAVSVAQRHLPAFVDAQAVETMRGRWEYEQFDARHGSFDAVFGGAVGRRVATKLVRALVAEGVPIDLEAILRACSGTDVAATPLDQLLSRARVELAPRLPGLRGTHVRVPEEAIDAVKACLQETEGGTITAPDSEQLSAARAALRAAVTGDDVHALVAPDELRAHVQRLATIDFPTLVVLSEREVATAVAVAA